jgi:NlpC/P60 family putative phage cell wall peptidase
METKRLSSPVYGGGGSTRSVETEGAGAPAVVVIARSWLGTPYIHQASVKGAGCDCLGLLRGVWRERHGGVEPEDPPAYSPDWAEATGRETLYRALARHLTEIAPEDLSPGDVALFRMAQRGPAKHCGIVGEKDGAMTLIHARQNRRVAEEPFSAFWRARLAHAFRL